MSGTNLKKKHQYYPIASLSSPVQHLSLFLICPAHPGSDPLGNEQQAGRDPLTEPSTAHWCVDTRGVEKITAAPSDVCPLCAHRGAVKLKSLLCCCVVGHVFCVMPGVLHI